MKTIKTKIDDLRVFAIGLECMGDSAHAEDIRQAIDIMHKYQTMQEILERVWNGPACMLDEAECLNQIMETYRTVR